MSFDGFPWCSPRKAELPHLLAPFQDYATDQSAPQVHFVIVNDRFTCALSGQPPYATAASRDRKKPAKR